MEKINDIYSSEEKERHKSVFITAFPTEDKFYIILSCLNRDYDALKNYIEQIKNLSIEKLKIFINNLLPTYIENIVLSPRLWDCWTTFLKNIL